MVEPEAELPTKSFAESMEAALAAADAQVPSKPKHGIVSDGDGHPRRSIAAVIGWLLFALATTLLGMAFFAQGEIMARFPQTRAIYQAMHFKVPPPGEGLEVLDPAPARILVDGTPTLQITGRIRNTGDMARPVPGLRATLRDADGKEIAGWDFGADEPRLEPGAETAFRTTLADPPTVPGKLDIVFREAF